MARTSTKVFVLEVMGRHAGWIAAAGGLAGDEPGDAPHIILFPEIPFDRDRFLEQGRSSASGRSGYCVVVVSEGVRDPDGKFLAEAGTRDAFGHAQLGGVGPVVADMTARHTATSTTGRSPTTCSARPGTSPPRSTSSRPMPWARRRSSWPCKASMRSCRPSSASRPGLTNGPSARFPSRQSRTARKRCPATTSPRMASASRRLPPLSRAARRRRSLPPLSRRPARICPHQGRRGREAPHNQA